MAGKLLIIGISGVTCGGKTTLSSRLKECLPKTRLISQDDYFLDVDDPRHTWISELNHINFDILSSLDMEKMNRDIQNIVRNTHLFKISNSNKGNKNIQSIETFQNLEVAVYEKVKKSDVYILIVEGFSIFNYKPLQNAFHLKYYFTLSKEECWQRREQRVYEPPDCPGYFEKCVWPEHEEQLREVREEVTDVKYFDGTSNNAFESVLLDIDSILD
ncbi:hypothetical protein Zmor_005865 [Zophobas morio]|uniref:Nicotinamide riboside kinase 1 n=1 Tax=Zophobas morio TaxID=2755281 RepID=A0AA38IQP6_9CUCU|nr:hypothetical protein Zmor_005865 [Zophobas morio]